MPRHNYPRDNKRQPPRRDVFDTTPEPPKPQPGGGLPLPRLRTCPGCTTSYYSEETTEGKTVGYCTNCGFEKAA